MTPCGSDAEWGGVVACLDLHKPPTHLETAGHPPDCAQDRGPKHFAPRSLPAVRRHARFVEPHAQEVDGGSRGFVAPRHVRRYPPCADSSCAPVAPKSTPRHAGSSRIQPDRSNDLDPGLRRQNPRLAGKTWRGRTAFEFPVAVLLSRTVGARRGSGGSTRRTGFAPGGSGTLRAPVRPPRRTAVPGCRTRRPGRSGMGRPR